MKGYRSLSVLTGAILFACLFVLLGSTAVQAGDILQMDMRYEGPQPSYPVQLQVRIYDGSEVDPNDLVGTSQVSFDGSSLSGLSCDAVVCITGVSVVDGMLVVNYTVNAYNNGDFNTNTTFQVSVGGAHSTLSLHTSCSQTLYLERPYPATTGSGTYFIEAGQGDCFIGPGYCPPNDNDLFWLVGEFRIPCLSPGTVTFNVYKDDDTLKGTATAYFDGATLTGISNDLIAVLDGAFVEGGNAVIQFTAFGSKSDGQFESNSRFEMVTPCGTFYKDQHTSCSQEILLDFAYPATPGGTVTYIDGCGCVESGDTPESCPFDDKLYWVAATFRVPCSAPADLIFQIFESDKYNEPEGTGTAYFNGTYLQGNNLDPIARLIHARMVDGMMEVEVEAFGYDNDKFKSSTSFRLTVPGCGTFTLVKYHTSCSQPIVEGVPFPLVGGGTMTISDYCGCEDSTVTTEETTWGGMKSLYR